MNGIGDSCDQLVDFLIDVGFQTCVCHESNRFFWSTHRPPRTVCGMGAWFDWHLLHGDKPGRCHD
jgi:hypothetical protein